MGPGFNRMNAITVQQTTQVSNAAYMLVVTLCVLHMSMHGRVTACPLSLTSHEVHGMHQTRFWGHETAM